MPPSSGRSGEKRRAFWLGFALFGWTYLVLSLVPSIEARLITTRALAYLDSKVPRSNAEALYDLLVANNSQPDALYLNNGNGGWILDVTAAGGSNPTRFTNILAGKVLTGSGGTTYNFVRIGHSLLALIAAFLGGQLSRHLFDKNRESVSESVNPQV
jgi:hypothetical protein